jgi:signal transduction histidine kinase
MARDLHDGLAQELAYIARRARRGGDAQEALRQISASADRALLESRRAIAALSLPMDERFDVVLARIAEETAARAGARIDLRLDAGLVIEREHAEGLIRIVSEAVGNATRHGHADSLVIELDDGPQRRLRVSDNGTGFESAQVAGRRAPGFGLVSMQERAAALGGTLHVESAPGQGTVVEVRF